ncbi:short-chain dehydrogenase [Neosynechococcus sphagnicola sy1]|uniref:Short-chain dehydrogenase n=1 Tax=Neosynechococcus sphagnicola sy1 TaxID=1497020 RepID=A0A098TMJ0_9CYAN|nr:SDR family NAD(P)-dependent oxidoreductase [Neosynechococcus sphagnicola]KGF73491.1 short-chain dehydrogenase [Neosynechococcus sphagnicola sy1]
MLNINLGAIWRCRESWQQRLYTRYGSWAVVTGASSGIGAAMVRKLAEAGLNLVLIGRSQTVLEEMAADLTTHYGIEVRVIRLDLALETGVETIGAATRALDVGLLVAAAGFGTSGSFLDACLEEEMAMLNVNCRALLGLSWYFGRRFAQQGRGGLVLMSSIVGFQGMPFAAHYAATKAYVQALAEALDVELAPLGVDVLAAAPGPTQSGFATRAGMRMGMALKPGDIALPILNALGRRATALPGFLSKLLTYSLVLLPRWLRVRIMGEVMKGMTKHRLGKQDLDADRK